MQYRIRTIREDELSLLDDFLYEAIFIPEGAEKPGKEIIELPELQLYVKDFGTKPGDFCLVADSNQQVIGAVWSRIIDDYGHIDDETPSLSLSLFPEYRGLGIGTQLLQAMIDLLKENGFKAASLSVQKANPATRLYQRLGFAVVSERNQEFVMRIAL